MNAIKTRAIGYGLVCPSGTGRGREQMRCFRGKSWMTGAGVATLMVVSAWAGGQAGTPPVITGHPPSKVSRVGGEVSFRVQASSATPLTYQWWLNDRALLNATQAVHAIENVQLTHAGAYRVVVMNVAGSVTSSNATLIVLPPTILVPFGADWLYLDDGSNPDLVWRDLIFDDSGWLMGMAQLGYGEGDEATVVSYGPDETNKHITTYFRRKFEVADPARVTNLFLQLLRDDGAAVYLNGVEIVRDNLPAGPLDYLTLAVAELSGAEETKLRTFPLDPVLLLQGQNVLAVEVHQASPASSDLSFDLELSAGVLPVPGSLDLSFDPEQGPDGPINALALQSDGKVVIGGAFESVNGVSRLGLARLRSHGALDMEFAAAFDADGEVRDVVVLDTGEVLVAGDFTMLGTESRQGVAKLSGATGLPTAWSPMAGGRVKGARVRSGVLYIAGELSRPDGGSATVAALNLATGEWLGWDLAVNGTARDLWVTDRLVYFAGEFDQVDGQSRLGMAALDRMTGALNSWQPQPDGPVFGFAAGATQIYVAGGFDFIGSVPRLGLALLEDEGGTLGGWNPGVDGDVFAVALWRDLIYVGGQFLQAGGHLNSNFAVLSRGAQPTAAPARTASFDGPVHRMIVQPNGGLVVAGEFFNVDGKPRRRLARLSGKPPADLWVPRIDVVGRHAEWFRLRAIGPAGRRLAIEGTTDFLNWLRLISGHAPDGALDFTDAELNERRFYRATVE